MSQFFKHGICSTLMMPIMNDGIGNDWYGLVMLNTIVSVSAASHFYNVTETSWGSNSLFSFIEPGFSLGFHPCRFSYVLGIFWRDLKKRTIKWKINNFYLHFCLINIQFFNTMNLYMIFLSLLLYLIWMLVWLKIFNM